ncbi:MAG: histidine phosphatase family protein [Acidimicrobiia bacterium]
MDLYLVRHGQPDWAPNRRARNDPSLTPLGHQQAKLVAERLAALNSVDNLWASPMRRARETVGPVSARLGVEPEVKEWLQEINNPPGWEGEPVEEVERILRESSLRTIEELWEGWPGGESFRSFHMRVVEGLTAGLQGLGLRPLDGRHLQLWTVDDPDLRLVVVAHAGTNAVILGHLLGLQPVPWEWERFRQPHTGVSRLTTIRISDGWAFSLRQLGDVSHLEPYQVTV